MSGTPKKTSSSPYQVLGNRPIDHWKVTELKEELKRRKLITRGLKDELVKRLDEALRIERESELAVAEADLNGVTQGQDIDDNVTTPEKAVVGSGKHSETPQKVEESDIDKTDEDWIKVNAVECLTLAGELNEEAVGVTCDDVVSVKEEVIVVQKTVVETVTETVVTETPISAQEINNEIANSEGQNDKSVYLLENESSKPEIGTEHTEGSKTQKDIEKPVQVDRVGSRPNVSGSVDLVEGSVKIIETQDHVPASEHEDTPPFHTYQVSEFSPSLGLEVKIGSISSDSVSLVEKNELKDNITAENIKFELNVKPEMVQPSSVNVAPDVGGSQSHPLDVEDPLEKKLSADAQDGNATFVAKTNADIEYSEKLNLDRSSGDDSMDEDAFDNKQMDTKTTSNVYDENNEQVKVEIKDEAIVDIASEGKENDMVKNKGVVAAEKRKLPGQQSTGNNEPVKRQRKWNTESVKVSEPQITVATISTLAKEGISLAVGRHGLFKPDNSEDATKEREVPPSANPPTNSLRIDRFLRPFTLKGVQELLGKTGKVISFWMDQIKTHCYVTYSSVEEAIETRNAVYNLQWPTNGGRLLVADFVDPQEVKNRVEFPSQSPSAPLSGPPLPQAAAPAKHPQPSPRQVQRQQHALQTAIPSPPPPIQDNVEPSIVTLDDLFRKTATLPRIYYLPLSEERVAEKVAARGKNVST